MSFNIKLEPTLFVDNVKGITDTRTGVVYPRTTEDMTLIIYGETITKPFEWFLNLARYDVYVPFTHKHRIKDIEFRNFGKSYNEFSEMLVQTKEPILIDDNHALILTLNNRAISKTGVIVNATTLEPVVNVITSLSKGYLYFSEQGLKNRRLVHRLLLETWVWNDNPENKYLGNHIDGNKNNNVLNNLEWVSAKDNIRHAVSLGLHTDNITCRTRHKETKEIKTHMSITDMTNYLLCSPRTKAEYLNMKLGHLVNGYEIRVSGDDRDWFYTTGNEEATPIWATKVYDVYKENVFVKRFYTREDTNSFLNIYDRTLTTDINSVLMAYKSPYRVKIIDLKKYGPYQAKNIHTEEIVQSDTLYGLSKKTGLNESTVNRVIRNCESDKTFNGWLMRYATTEPWATITQAALTNTTKNKVKVVNLFTGDETIFNSINEAAELLNITRKTIRQYLNNEKPYLNKRFIRL